MNKKEFIIASALSGIFLSAQAEKAKHTEDLKLEVEKCYGIQKKEQNGCAVEKDEIAAANTAFKNNIAIINNIVIIKKFVHNI